MLARSCEVAGTLMIALAWISSLSPVLEDVSLTARLISQFGAVFLMGARQAGHSGPVGVCFNCCTHHSQLLWPHGHRQTLRFMVSRQIMHSNDWSIAAVLCSTTKHHTTTLTIKRAMPLVGTRFVPQNRGGWGCRIQGSTPRGSFWGDDDSSIYGYPPLPHAHPARSHTG